MIPDKVIITGITGGLGMAVSRFIPSSNLIGIRRNNLKKKYSQKIVVDLRNYEAVEYMCKQYANNNFHNNEKLGIVLAAGELGNPASFENSNLKDWKNVFEVNVLGNFAVLLGFLPHMIKSGFGRVVVVSGGGAASPFPNFGGYSISKVSIVREVENISVELRDVIPDFSIIALAPGAMPTKMLEKVKATGAVPRTLVETAETANFIKNFLETEKEEALPLSGKFIHVRDDLTSDFKDKWVLRRVE
jgi:3-oxoacyl-[acyl-carrier protein] reductase